MRELAAVCFALAILTVAPAAPAQQLVPASTGRAIEIGLRVGYGVPFGKTGRTASAQVDDDLSRSIKGQVPIGLDIGYRATPNIDVRLLFQFGFGQNGSGGDGICNQSGVSCSSSDLILGVGAHFHPNPTASFDPWIGLGVAYERVDFSFDFSGNLADLTSSATGSGIEYVDIQLGGDVSVSPNVAVGPFVSFAAGQYLNITQQRATVLLSQDVTDKSFHEWLLFGVRGVYSIRL